MGPGYLRALGVAIVLGVAAIASAKASFAGDLMEFHDAISRANGNYRVAVNYLRTGNVDFAALELEGMIENWNQLSPRGRDEFPEPYAQDPDVRRTLTDIGEIAVLALAYVDEGDPGQALKLLKPIRSMLHNMRARNGIYLLEDCLYEVSRAFVPLYAYKGVEPDFALSGDGAKLIAAAAVTANRLARCDAMASSGIRENGEFRRLIDGALASLARVRDTVQTADNSLLSRLLIEIKSFDRLLFFRYG